MAFETNTSYWIDAFKSRLDGKYELRDLVSADSDSATFRTASKELVRFFHLNAADATRQVELWQSLGRSPHPNLLSIIGSGQTAVDDAQPAAYVISESAEEGLGSVLQERSLTGDEADGLLRSLVPALSHLHARGFVHGRICPAEVFATGDTIKLSSDCARLAGEKPAAYRSFPAYLAPEQQDQNATPAADVWCLGASLFEVLTRSPFVIERRAEVLNLPAPFNRLIERCVAPDPSARPAITDLLSPQIPKEAPQKLLAAPVSATPSFSGQPEARPERIGSPFIFSAAETPKPGSRTPLALAAAAIVLLLIVASLWWAKNRTAPTQDDGPKVPDAKVVTPPQPVPSPVVPAQQAAATMPPPPSTPAVNTPAPATGHGQVWRVVLWTYGDLAMAQKKAASVAEQHPDLHPEAFTPDTGSKMHLVVIGGQMTRDQARELQRQARQLGLPRDAYFQNFSH